MRAMVICLPVKDLEVSTEFLTNLFGVSKHAGFSDDTASLVALEENLHIALVVEERFDTYLNGNPIADPSGAETLICVSVDSPDNVDEIVETALATGGKPLRGVFDQGPSHCGSFIDPDGHFWEIMHFPEPWW